MITLNELQDMWKVDCKVDELILGQESTKIPELHAKYLNYLSTFKLQLRKSKREASNFHYLSLSQLWVAVVKS